MSFRRCGDLADIRYQKGGRDLPLKCPKFREPAEVPFINRNHSNANSGGTHGNERVIRESSPPYLFITIFCGHKCKHAASLRPII